MEKQGKRMLKEVRLSNFLSFGPHASGIELKPLNILVGANGSGKSNFIESLALLKTAPFHIADLIRDGGGVKDWIYKGPGKEKNATIEIVTSDALRYRLSFTASGTKFEIVDEVLECESPGEDEKRPCFFYK